MGKASPVTCEICGKTISRKSDLSRHMLTHEQVKKFPCPYREQGCPFRTNQQSNIASHLNVHTRERPFKCTTCPFRTGDRSSLCRHRQARHDCLPRTNTRTLHRPPTSTPSRTTLRRQQRAARNPYSSATFGNGYVMDGNNTSAALNNAEYTPANYEPPAFSENTPPFAFDFGVVSAPVTSMARHSQLFDPEQWGFTSVDMAAQPVSQSIHNTLSFDSRTPFKDWRANVPVNNGTYLPMPAVPYGNNSVSGSLPVLHRINTPTPTPRALFPPVVSYTLSNAVTPVPPPAPTPVPAPAPAPVPVASGDHEMEDTGVNYSTIPSTSFTLPEQEFQPSMDDTSFAYQYDAKAAEASLEALFHDLHPSFVPTDSSMDGHSPSQNAYYPVPQGLCDFNQSYLYATTAGAA